MKTYKVDGEMSDGGVDHCFVAGLIEVDFGPSWIRPGFLRSYTLHILCYRRPLVLVGRNCFMEPGQRCLVSKTTGRCQSSLATNQRGRRTRRHTKQGAIDSAHPNTERGHVWIAERTLFRTSRDVSTPMEPVQRIWIWLLSSRP
jgi:hypothetical protein